MYHNLVFFIEISFFLVSSWKLYSSRAESQKWTERNEQEKPMQPLPAPLRSNCARKGEKFGIWKIVQQQQGSAFLRCQKILS